MKAKITYALFTMLACAMTGTAQINNLQQGAEVAVPLERLPNQYRQTSEWYNYGQSIYDMGGNVNYFRNYLFPDSTVVFEASSAMSSVWKHSLGQVLDPTSFNFLTNTPLSATQDYTLDSVRFWYRYFRFQSGAPDTVVIQIFKHNRHTFNTFSTSGAPYAYVNYNASIRKGATPDMEVTLLLTDADTAVGAQRSIELPVYIYVAPDQNISTSITYFPGNPFNVGDTIDAYMSPAPVNQINAFVVYDFRDNDKTIDAGKYNNELNASIDVRYNMSTNGWNGKYIPGTAWNSGFYHLDVDFKVTSDPVSVNEITNDASATALFPNPAANEFRIKNSELNIESVDVYSALGKLISGQRFDTGNRQKEIRVDVSAFASGIYTVRIKTENGYSVKKFVKP